jgi:hypothetical protein
MTQRFNGIAILDRANRLLEQASTLEDLKSVRDVAESARTFAKAAHLGLELQNRAAEIKLRAERKVGDFLREMHLRGGDRRSKCPRITLKLDDLGITKEQSSRWQLLASVPEAQFVCHVRAQNELGRELTARGLLRLTATHRSVTAPTRKATKPKPIYEARLTSAVGSPDIEILALLSELRNHAAMLAEILKPLFEGQSTPRLPERRLISRLIGEIGELLAEVDKRYRGPVPLNIVPMNSGT